MGITLKCISRLWVVMFCRDIISIVCFQGTLISSLVIVLIEYSVPATVGHAEASLCCIVEKEVTCMCLLCVVIAKELHLRPTENSSRIRH